MSGNSLFQNSAFGRRIKSDDELDITPMIDCVFLLLIFFMVTSTMNPESSLHVPPARHGEGVNTKAATIITVAVRNGEPAIYLGEKVEGAPVSMNEIPAFVRAGLNHPDGARRTVIIKADRELPSGLVEEIARTANQVEGIEKFYVGVQDKR